MAEHDDDSKASGDPDRAAILARRQRFIALALSGLATTACTDGTSTDPDNKKVDEKKAVEPPPEPCLSVPIQTPPEPCLKVAPPPEPCLKVAPPPPEPGSETGGDDETDGGSSAPPPQPCLSKPAPCLRKAPPKTCLKVAPPPPEE